MNERRAEIRVRTIVSGESCVGTKCYSAPWEDLTMTQFLRLRAEYTKMNGVDYYASSFERGEQCVYKFVWEYDIAGRRWTDTVYVQFI